MTYLEPDNITRLQKFAKKKKITMSQVIREALNARMSDGDPYNAGFNAGIEESINIIKKNKASQMRFPSGSSFAELMEMDLLNAKILEVNNG
jgi:uncharacterized membrane protein YgcG